MIEFLNWLRAVKPSDAAKWLLVVFCYCLAVLVLVSIILSMFGVYS